jgi:uncharacterized protein
MPNIESHSPGSFCWFELNTMDQDAAKKFYSALFGYEVFDAPMGPDAFYTMFKVDGREVGAACTIQPAQRQMGVPPHWAVYVLVTDAEASAKRAAELGATVLAPAFDVMDAGRMAIIRDPTGVHFNLWEAKRNPGTGIKGVEGSVCWLELYSPEAERAKQFYADLFGWTFTPGQGDMAHYLEIKNGGTAFGGLPPKEMLPPGVSPHWATYFQVTDCTASAEKIKALGGTVHIGPMEIPQVGRFVIAGDPQGAEFVLFQPATR